MLHAGPCRVHWLDALAVQPSSSSRPPSLHVHTFYVTACESFCFENLITRWTNKPRCIVHSTRIRFMRMRMETQCRTRDWLLCPKRKTRRRPHHSSAGCPESSAARFALAVREARDALLTLRLPSAPVPQSGRAPVGRAAAAPDPAWTPWGELLAAAACTVEAEEAVEAREESREKERAATPLPPPPLSSATAERGAPAAEEGRETEWLVAHCCCSNVLSERSLSASACVGGPESTQAVRTGCAAVGLLSVSLLRGPCVRTSWLGGSRHR